MCIRDRNLNIADNIFVLRPGFRQWVIRTKILNRQMEPFLEDIGMDIPLNKDVEKLSTFERIIVELLRAVIMGYHLIVLDEVGALVSDDELKKAPWNYPSLCEKRVFFSLYLFSSGRDFQYL